LTYIQLYSASLKQIQLKEMNVIGRKRKYQERGTQEDNLSGF